MTRKFIRTQYFEIHNKYFFLKVFAVIILTTTTRTIPGWYRSNKQRKTLWGRKKEGECPEVSGLEGDSAVSPLSVHTVPYPGTAGFLKLPKTTNPKLPKCTDQMKLQEKSILPSKRTRAESPNNTTSVCQYLSYFSQTLTEKP